MNGQNLRSKSPVNHHKRIFTPTVFALGFVRAGSAAVSAIPRAPAGVILVVTHLIVLVAGLGTCCAAGCTSLGRKQFVVWVFAEAVLFAVGELRVLCVFAAAVTSVPSTSAVVVFHVANAVLNPFFSPAEAATLLAWVEALALRAAKVVVVALAAAISTIPSTHAVVVPVVADAIALVRGGFAVLALANRVRACFLVLAIQACALFVVFLAELFAGSLVVTAVATVPIAASVVV